MAKRPPIFWHLFPYYLAVIVFSLIAVTWYNTSAMRATFLRQTVENLQTQVRLIEKQFLSPVASGDHAAVDAVCKEIGRISGTRITLILPGGRVVGDSHGIPAEMDNHGRRLEIREAMEKRIGSSIRFSRTLDKNMMYVAAPLVQDHRIIAVLRAAISVSTIDEKLGDMQRKIAFGGLLMIVLAAVLTVVLSRHISRPVEEMKKGAQRFAQGDFDHRLLIPDTDELARLADTMNQMAQSLDDRIKTVVRQRNELEAVFSSMTDGVLAVDREEQILFCNNALADMFKYAPVDLIGRSIQEVIRSSDLQRFVRNALELGESIERDVFVVTDRERTFRITGTPLRGAREETIGALFLLHDVTQIRFLENMRRDFAVNVSHEIKTPLTAVKGFVETLLGDWPENPEEARRFLTIIDKHVNRLAAIVEDLISLSRIENEDGRKEIKLEPADICKIVEDAAQACQEKADAKSIRIERSCEGPLTAEVNPPLMERALVNLIDNAVNYSDPQSRIQLTARRADSHVCIGIRDQGIGIARKDQQRIFERFYRVDKARSRKSGGTGLGLAIVKHIVLAHGGRITLESAPGSGSYFEIHLPTT